MGLIPISQRFIRDGCFLATVPQHRRRGKTRSEAPKHPSLPPAPDLPVPTGPDRLPPPELLLAVRRAFFVPLRARLVHCACAAVGDCRFPGVRGAVPGASNHLGGGIVRPNSVGLARVARPETFQPLRLCESRPEARAFVAPDVSPGGRRTTAPSSSSSSPFATLAPALSRLVRLCGVWEGLTCEGVSPLLAVLLPFLLPIRLRSRGSDCAPLRPLPSRLLPPWRCPPGGF
jgi:hypothetical protein